VDDQIAIYPPPLCSTLDVLYGGTAPDTTLSSKPDIDEGGALGSYYDGESLTIKVTPKQAGYLYVDLVDGQKREVMHLLPNSMRTDNRVKAGDVVTIGTTEQERRAYAVGPPYGLKLVIALRTSAPLFNGARKSREPVDAYLDVLQQRLRALMAASGKAPPQFEKTAVVFRHR